MDDKNIRISVDILEKLDIKRHEEAAHLTERFYIEFILWSYASGKLLSEGEVWKQVKDFLEKSILSKPDSGSVYGSIGTLRMRSNTNTPSILQPNEEKKFDGD